MSTFIIAIIVFGGMALAIRYMVKKNKSGGSTCGCNCSNCPSHKMCHK